MITAASNSRIKRLVQLNQKSKLRRTEDVFLAEGVKMFLEAPREQLQEVYVSTSNGGTASTKVSVLSYPEFSAVTADVLAIYDGGITV